MGKIYTATMIDLLTQLGIPIPENLTMDQKQVERLVAAIEVAMDAVPTSTGNAVVGDVRAPKTFSNSTTMSLVGTLVDNEDANVEVTTKAGTLIPAGIYDGTGRAILSAAELAKVITGNIRASITLLGIAGKTEVVDTTIGAAAAIAANIILGKEVFVNGLKVTGTMAEQAANVEVVDLAGTLIAEGHYDGTDRAILSAAEIAKVITDNIKSGITILGVAGKTEVVDTTEASNAAAAANIDDGYFAWVNGARIEGTRV